MGSTNDGYTLLNNHDGELCICKALVASNILASNPEERTIEDKLFPNNIKGLFFSQSQLDIVAQNRSK